MNKFKVMKNALAIFAFLLSVTAVANTTHQQGPVRQEGPEPPPGVSIDNYIIVLLALAIILAGISLFKKKNITQTS